MGKINAGRVILGGLLAGLMINIGEVILNVAILGEDFEAAMENLGMAEPGGNAIAVWVILCFLLGILAVWLYAAIRPRFGPGVRTAVIAGLAVYAAAYVYPSIGYMMLNLFPNSLYVTGLAWGLFEIPIATAIGAWAYKEEGAGAAAGV